MPTPDPAAPDVVVVQRRTLALLFVTQIVGGVGQAIGSSVGALLAAEMGSVGVSGLAQSASVVGAALLAIPATRLVRRAGRRPSLAAAYLVAASGAAVVVTAATRGSLPLLFVGFFLFGAGTTAGYQARYAAVDLAPPARHGRHLSLVVWGTTLGAVAGPNLAPVAGAALGPYGIPTLAAPYAFSAALFAVVAAVLALGLRPDPLLVARAAHTAPAERATPNVRALGMREAFAALMERPPARLGVAATAVGHLVMVGVMSMTPVHIRGAGHDAAHTLSLVGLVLSVHVAGMYAFAPLMGFLTDRIGRRRVILVGIVVLLAACAVAGTAAHDTTRLALGLTLLGLGWSATMVAGSTLVAASVPNELRPSAQGVSDLIMGLAGASAGALAGIVVQAWGYPTLTLLASLATAPLAVLALTTVERPVAQPVSA